MRRDRILDGLLFLLAAISAVGIYLAGAVRVVLLAAALVAAAAAPADAMVWKFFLCQEDYRSALLNRYLPEVEAEIAASYKYTQQMTGTHRDSYDYLWWFGAWGAPWSTKVLDDAGRLDDIRTGGTEIAIDCHSFDPECEPSASGEPLAWSHENQPSVHLCGPFWYGETDEPRRVAIIAHELTKIFNGTKNNVADRVNALPACVTRAAARDMAYTTADGYCWEGFMEAIYKESREQARNKSYTGFKGCALGGGPGAGNALLVLFALGTLALPRRTRTMGSSRRRWIAGAAVVLVLVVAWAVRPRAAPTLVTPTPTPEAAANEPVPLQQAAERARREALVRFLAASPQPAPTPQRAADPDDIDKAEMDRINAAGIPERYRKHYTPEELAEQKKFEHVRQEAPRRSSPPGPPMAVPPPRPTNGE